MGDIDASQPFGERLGVRVLVRQRLAEFKPVALDFPLAVNFPVAVKQSVFKPVGVDFAVSEYQPVAVGVR